ncbi:class I SAM-dependent methyltransferase [Fontimonas sp. SYSU GA230001]|uniref:class I SAM-dependent methyltransferase n=1 Tax=Fontimonas sp. SYSU GA230001 TaxID=3142450 RepID=UPI0032B5B6A2
MSKPISNYYDAGKAHEAIQKGQHRAWVGGLWDEIGRLQGEFLRQQGLTPDMRVVDVGCGCFRGGVHLVEYLDPGRYYGIDISQELLDAGYDKEIAPRGLAAKLPRANLLCDAGFTATRFGVAFDMGLAQSVFTHLPFNHIRLCLTRLAPAFRVGGRFYATAFIVPDDQDWTQPARIPNLDAHTHPTEDPYHYRVADFAYCVERLPWTFEFIGDWGHPRGQRMLKFTRTG